VPAHTPRSSWFLTAVHTRFVHVWHVPTQSLRFVHSTHWLVAASHVAVVPVQYLFAVQATHRPLVAQAGVPGRAAQSLSAVHRPDASTVTPPEGASAASASATPTTDTSGGLAAAGLSATVSASASVEPDIGGIGASGPAPSDTSLPPSRATSTLAPAASGPAPSDTSLPPSKATSALAPAASVERWLSTGAAPSLPPSPARTQSRSGVHTYPGRHGSLSCGAQMFQSRLTQLHPAVTGKTSVSTHKQTKRWFLMFEVFGCEMKKLLGKSERA